MPNRVTPFVSAAAAPWVLAATVLVWLPGGFSRFVLPKLLVACLLIVVVALAPARGRLPRVVALLGALGMVVAALAALLSTTPLVSFVGRWPRYEGVPTLLVYLGCAWAGARHGASDVRRLRAAVAFVAVVLGVLALLDAVGLSPTGGATRDGSVLGNASDQGMVAAAALVLLIASPGQRVGLSDRRRRWELVGAASAAVTLALSGSRASLVAAVVVLAGLGLLRVRERRLIPLALALLAVAVVVVPQTRDRLLEGYTVSTRLVQWRETLDLVVHHLLLGVGPSGYLDAIPRFETPATVRVIGTAQVADSAHSAPLQALTAGGVPLLLVAIGLAATVAWHALVAVRQDPALAGLLAALVVLGLALLVNFTTAGPVCFGAFLAGVLVSEPLPRRPSELIVPRVVAAASGVLAVILVLACVGEVETRAGVDRVARGDVAAGARSFATAADRRPWDPDTAMIAAQSLAAPASGGDTRAARDAAAFARRSLSHAPDSCPTGVALGVARIALGELPQARTTLDHVVQVCPARPAPLVQRGIARFGLRDVAGARADLRRAQALAPRSPVPRRILRQIDARVGAAAP